ncbi:MAG: outer membrane beta-barrel protein [Chitinophagia bacterium]|jgi:hypothetical protein
MKKFILILIISSLANFAKAQTVGTIRGKLIDSTNKQSLKDATITVLDARDSTLEVFGLAAADGSFSITNIALGKMLVQVKFQGYEPFERTITFTKENATVNLGSIYLRVAAKSLGEVTVTASPVQMKKDTVEFTAGAFKTKPNAVAEDLLKKIPGMEVGKDGTIRAQGETVQRVLVNGKRFFGDDPKMATKNLPPDVIDKIQVFDDQSDQAKFTGFDDGNRVKTINITTKKDMRKGAFGRAVAGIGSDERYDESFNLSLVKGDRQVTLLGQANNVNKQNFNQMNLGGGRGGGGFGGGGGGGGGMMTVTMGGGSGAGGGSGITSVLAGGINYRDAWSPKIDAYGSYFYNAPKTYLNQDNFSQNILTADSSVFNNSSSSSDTRNENHRFTFNLEDRIDSNNSLIFRPNIAFQSNSPSAVSTNTTTAGSKGLLINQSQTRTSSFNSGYNISGATLSLRHRFAKKGRTMSMEMGFSSSLNQGDGFNYSVNSFYKPVFRADTINQYYRDTSKTLSLNPSISYTEPIGKKGNQMIEIRYTYAYNKTSSQNSTYNFINATGKFSQFDSLFSNSYEYTSTANTANLSYRVQKAKYNLNFGSGLQFMDINSFNTTKNVLVARSFVNLTPQANFTYNFTKTSSLRMFYNGRTGQPTTSQLQPVVTTSDSVNFQVGNPDLRPQFTNSLRVLYASFDPFTQRIIFATVNATITNHDIQSSITTLPTGGRKTTYVNLNGTYNISGYFNYGFPIKKPKSNLNLQSTVNYNQSQSLLNGISNYTRSTILAQTVKWTTNLKKNFDMNLSTSYTYNPVRNTLSPNQNTNFTTWSMAADFTIYSDNGWIIASDFDLTKYGNRAPGYNTSVFLITPSIAKQFLKNKAGELRLSCFDVLKQNVAISSSASANQIINTRTNNLTQYFMLTFTYNLRSFAGQQQMQRNMMMRGMMPPGGEGMRFQMNGGGGGNNRGRGGF